MDAYLTYSVITFELSSYATLNGAMVGNSSVKDKIMFSGGFKARGLVLRLMSYTNQGSATTGMSMGTNRFVVEDLTLAPTRQAYQRVGLNGELAPGNSSVMLTGGIQCVLYEMMIVTARKNRRSNDEKLGKQMRNNGLAMKCAGKKERAVR